MFLPPLPRLHIFDQCHWQAPAISPKSPSRFSPCSNCLQFLLASQPSRQYLHISQAHLAFGLGVIPSTPLIRMMGLPHGTFLEHSRYAEWLSESIDYSCQSMSRVGERIQFVVHLVPNHQDAPAL